MKSVQLSMLLGLGAIFGALLSVSGQTICDVNPSCQLPLSQGGFLCSNEPECEMLDICEKCFLPASEGGCACNNNCQCFLPIEDTNPILYWNEVAMNASRDDVDENGPIQVDGPTATSRAQAMVHAAMYDTLILLTGLDGGNTYLPRSALRGLPRSRMNQNSDAVRAGIGRAAFRVLRSFYTRQRAFLGEALSDYEDTLRNSRGFFPRPVRRARTLGARVGIAMLRSRDGDGSENADDFENRRIFPFMHVVDPLNPDQGFEAPSWGEVRPFGFVDTDDLRNRVNPLPEPISLGVYVSDRDEVIELGTRGEGFTNRMRDLGVYWGYDCAVGIGCPIRLYNDIVRQIVLIEFPFQGPGFTVFKAARLFGVLHVAMGDCGIQAWYEKYRWNFWRPIVGIRNGTGLPGDALFTESIPDWEPWGSARTNNPAEQPSFSPNFPAYPSGHATFGSAALRVVEIEMELPEGYTFPFLSDENNGIAFDANSTDLRVRPAETRTFTINEAIEQNQDSRLYLGVHWRMDSTTGGQIGEEIAALVSASFPMQLRANSSASPPEVEEADPTCSLGVRGAEVCCPAMCGACGGRGCASRPGGRANCCFGPIRNSGDSCDDGLSPCLVTLA